MNLQGTEKQAKIIIGIFSLVVLIIVSLLYTGSGKLTETGLDLSFLPAVHATINSCVALCLVLGLYFVKQKNITAHRTVMMIAIGLSACFLFTYVAYHATHEPTKFGGEGLIKTVYYIILLTHVVLAAAILPFILMTAYRALSSDIPKHKKIAKWTWPIWLYVSISGVLVYFLISPYY